jgi:glycosyltransferase involved in cell wall biosynthesis
VAAASADSETAREIGAADAGIVVPPEDPQAFRSAILSLRGDAGLAEKLGQRGTTYADSVLSPTRVLAEYESFVDDLASRNGQPGRLGRVAA